MSHRSLPSLASGQLLSLIQRARFLFRKRAADDIALACVFRLVEVGVGLTNHESQIALDVWLAICVSCRKTDGAIQTFSCYRARTFLDKLELPFERALVRTGLNNKEFVSSVAIHMVFPADIGEQTSHLV